MWSNPCSKAVVFRRYRKVRQENCMKYQVIYTSKTGNTEKLAKKIFEVLPGNEKDIERFEPGMKIADADLYFIGFWIKRGTCSMDFIDYIAELHGKRIVLFGTCGMAAEEAYYKKLLDEIEVWIAEDSECVGRFMCQGKMPMTVREKYQAMLGGDNDEQVRRMIQNFDKALTHPDKEDMSHIEEFVKKIIL